MVIMMKWSQLRMIGNNPAFRLTPLFPVVGYIILFSDNFVGIFFINMESLGQYQGEIMSFESRLMFLYFGLIFLAVSSTVYSIWCPPAVRKEVDAESFVARSVGNVAQSEAMRMSRFVDDQIDGLIRLDGLAMPEYRLYRQTQDAAKQVLEGTHYSSLPREYFISIISIYYDQSDISKPGMRFVCASTMAFGFILLLCPSFDVFFSIVIRSVHNIFAAS